MGERLFDLVVIISTSSLLRACWFNPLLFGELSPLQLNLPMQRIIYMLHALRSRVWREVSSSSTTPSTANWAIDSFFSLCEYDMQALEFQQQLSILIQKIQRTLVSLLELSFSQNLIWFMQNYHYHIYTELLISKMTNKPARWDDTPLILSIFLHLIIIFQCIIPSNK